MIYIILYLIPDAQNASATTDALYATVDKTSKQSKTTNQAANTSASIPLYSQIGGLAPTVGSACGDGILGEESVYSQIGGVAPTVDPAFGAGKIGEESVYDCLDRAKNKAK